MGYVVQLDAYEGPFDLLLDLIVKNEIDIWDIPIADITQQYLEYIHSLQVRDLAIGGEFLVMAATLLRIKAKLLLPQEQIGLEESEEEEDPREELVELLLRYRFFKEVAVFLRDRYQASVYYYDRGNRTEELDVTPVYTNLVGDITLNELAGMYRELLVEAQREPPIHSVVQRVSVQERLALVRIQLMGQSSVSFGQLLQNNTASEIVVTFLAVLELVRLGEIRVLQEKPFGNIQVRPYALEMEVMG
jgi:segregation and condensation protein A